MAGTAGGEVWAGGPRGWAGHGRCCFVPSPVSYPLPFFCCAQPPAASASGSTCSASTCSALQSDVAGLRTSVRALQSALNPDADGTINPARVCLRSMCLEGLDGVDEGLNDNPTNSASDKHLYVRSKDRTQTLARFSTAWNRFLVSPGDFGAGRV
jgi:hypothetical protein